MAIKIKHGKQKPIITDLDNYQLGYSTDEKKLFIRDNNSIVPIDTVLEEWLPVITTSSNNDIVTITSSRMSKIYNSISFYKVKLYEFYQGECLAEMLPRSFNINIENNCVEAQIFATQQELNEMITNDHYIMIHVKYGELL